MAFPGRLVGYKKMLASVRIRRIRDNLFRGGWNKKPMRKSGQSGFNVRRHHRRSSGMGHIDRLQNDCRSQNKNQTKDIKEALCQCSLPAPRSKPAKPHSKTLSVQGDTVNRTTLLCSEHIICPGL